LSSNEEPLQSRKLSDKRRIKENNNLLFYNDLDRLLKGEQCYNFLPAHTAQHTLKLLSRNWKAYFAALKEWKKRPQKFLSCPRPPYYKKPTGETIAIFSNQQARIINGWVVLPRKVKLYDYMTKSNHSNLFEVYFFIISLYTFNNFLPTIE